MGNKISYALKKCKSVFIIAIILWVVLSIVLIAPVSISWVKKKKKGNGNFIETLMNSNIGDIGRKFRKGIFRRIYW